MALPPTASRPRSSRVEPILIPAPSRPSLRPARALSPRLGSAPEAAQRRTVRDLGSVRSIETRPCLCVTWNYCSNSQYTSLQVYMKSFGSTDGWLHAAARRPSHGFMMYRVSAAAQRAGRLAEACPAGERRGCGSRRGSSYTAGSRWCGLNDRRTTAVYRYGVHGRTTCTKFSTAVLLILLS
jgi:hypothetical protein